MGIFDLKIGFKCNNNCRHCVVNDKKDCGSLSVPVLCKLIEEAPAGYVIQITGGEPSIYEYLPSLLEKCHECDHEVVLQTNGTGFSDYSFTQKCAPFIDHAHVAIHSIYEEVHDCIVQSSGMWKKTMQGLYNLQSLGVYCTTQTVLSKYNIKTLYDTFSSLQFMYPGILMSMTYPHQMGNALKNREEVCFRYSDYKDEILRTLQDFYPFIFTEAIPPCYLHPFTSVVPSAEKDIIENLKKGIISRIGVDFSDSYNRKNYNSLDLSNHRKGPLCKDCIYNKECIGVWKEYIDLYKNCLDLFPIKEENT